MAKEVKIAATYQGTALPSVYAVDTLKLGEQGAVVVYKQKVFVTDAVTGAVTSNNEQKVLTIRFATADSPLDETVLGKLSSAVQSLLTSYLGGVNDYTVSLLFAGTLTYSFYHDSGMQLTNVGVSLGVQRIGNAHYLGSQPHPDTTPSQFDWVMGDTAPDAIKGLLTSNLPTVIQKELYGG